MEVDEALDAEDLLGGPSQRDEIDYRAYEDLLEEEPTEMSHYHEEIDFESMYE